MIDWKSKLTSRKFWMAVIGFVTGLLTYLGMGAEEAEKIGSLILMGASIAAYIIGEGLIDAAAANSVNFAPYDDFDEDYDEDKPPDEEPDKSGLFHGTSGDVMEDDGK